MVDVPLTFMPLEENDMQGMQEVAEQIHAHRVLGPATLQWHLC